jgi:hypothetical protein
MNLREGFEFFFFKGFDRSFVGAPMNPLVSLMTPKRKVAVGLTKVLTGRDSEEILDVSDDPLHASFLVGSARRTGMNGEAIMAREIEKLGIEDGLRASAQDDASKIVIAESVGNASDLFEGFDVAIEEELQGVSRIKSSKEIARIGQDEDKSIKDAEGKGPLHPVHLDLFPR